MKVKQFSDWLVIIAQVLELIAEGMSKPKAVSEVAHRYHVSEREIRKRGNL